MSVGKVPVLVLVLVLDPVLIPLLILVPVLVLVLNLVPDLILHVVPFSVFCLSQKGSRSNPSSSLYVRILNFKC